MLLSFGGASSQASIITGGTTTQAESLTPKLRVIAMSLYGNESIYIRGAIRNAELAKEIYDGELGRRQR